MRAVIVTGASRGLGESLAAALLERNFRVLGIGRASSARLSGEAYRFTQLDLAQCERIAEVLRPAFRALADARPAAPIGVLGRLDDSAIAASLAINLAAPVALANLFCQVFGDDAMSPRIINVSSGAAQMPLPGGGLYSIAKAGLEMLTKQLAAEQHASSFRAITVRPGVIDTPMQAFMRSQPRTVLPSVGLFEGFHKSGQLVAPDVVARKIVERLVLGEVEQGRTYSYQEL